MSHFDAARQCNDGSPHGAHHHHAVRGLGLESSANFDGDRCACQYWRHRNSRECPTLKLKFNFLIENSISYPTVDRRPTQHHHHLEPNGSRQSELFFSHNRVVCSHENSIFNHLLCFPLIRASRFSHSHFTWCSPLQFSHSQRTSISD